MFGQPQTCRKNVQKYHDLCDASSHDIGITSIYTGNCDSIESQSVPLDPSPIDGHRRCFGIIQQTIRNIAPYSHSVRVSPRRIRGDGPRNPPLPF